VAEHYQRHYLHYAVLPPPLLLLLQLHWPSGAVGWAEGIYCLLHQLLHALDLAC
jgi:hypothetical protein